MSEHGPGPDPRRERLWDGGAQPERTRLAWSRTAMAACALAALLARGVAVHSPLVAGALMLVGAVTAVGITGAAWRRYRAGRRRGEPVAPSVALPMACAALTVLLGLAALVVVLATG